jgi:signal transduction histidine kinase
LADDAISNDLLRAIVENIGAGVFVIDEHGNCLLSNPIADDLLNTLDIKNLSDRSKLSGFYQPDRVTRIPPEQDPFAAAMRAERVDKQEIFVRNAWRPFGGWIRVTITPLVLNHSEKSNRGGIIVIEDITEQKSLAEEVQRSNRDLQQFAYVAAHDLQEPLRSITGFGNLLVKGLEGTKDEKVIDHLDRMMGAAKRMQSLIAALLLYARIDTRAKAPAICNSNELVENVLIDMSALIKDTGVQIEIGILPDVVADSDQISQVFHNLIGNALKYRSEKPKIMITANSNERNHHFCVTDNGIGMEKKYQERVFIIFQRLHNKSQYEGVGIGLALCKKIIENHGGQIWIDSRIGEGTDVHFTLPVIPKGKKYAKA